ncbi:MAG: YihA family ribosome biogenesis GTP-binding protein [Rickettsiaceae bacterium]|nr:YihA family ribosome biogenesis GTP-binding protein [Rickettsiaceae bacterium]
MSVSSIKIFKKEAKFIAGAAKVNQLPKLYLPQIAFIGKSNVGKSSLINKVCNRKFLAKVSHTPGRTQQINFFSIDDKFLLVDLPGYGFAKVPGEIRLNWENLISFYLKNTTQLKLINLLIDSRRGFKNNDWLMMDFLREAALNFQIIFTKCDEIKNREDFFKEMHNMLILHGYNNIEMIITSSKKGDGIKELQVNMLKVL